MHTDKGVVLATAPVQELSREKVVLPPLNMIERICALATASTNRKIYLTLAETLNDGHLGCDIRPMCQAPSIYWNTFKGVLRIRVFKTQIGDSATNCLGAGENAGIRG
jgi:hypothetical protein